ncbi:hypothetical protein F5B22DRAFT_92895 [Xylaria bambusicola]|uniref:uncharacterized protein n=1 Tax=Xylaria bambusicola TaxID=326684 RepID=UPI002008BAE1|nr:uncharacterized protein F5B22DRAFT_92895 [Xylaria bambusicola]KAI0518120.1 hypothetical protein F5B22DRAFT_92895 [Xylaria bambusicola]
MSWSISWCWYSQSRRGLIFTRSRLRRSTMLHLNTLSVSSAFATHHVDPPHRFDTARSPSASPVRFARRIAVSILACWFSTTTKRRPRASWAAAPPCSSRSFSTQTAVSIFASVAGIERLVLSWRPSTYGTNVPSQSSRQVEYRAWATHPLYLLYKDVASRKVMVSTEVVDTPPFRPVMYQ